MKQKRYDILIEEEEEISAQELLDDAKEDVKSSKQEDTNSSRQEDVKSDKQKDAKSEKSSKHNNNEDEPITHEKHPISEGSDPNTESEMDVGIEDMSE